MAAVDVAVAVEDGVAAENEAADVTVVGISQFLFCRGGRNPGAGVLVREMNSEIIISNTVKSVYNNHPWNPKEKWPMVVVQR